MERTKSSHLTTRWLTRWLAAPTVAACLCVCGCQSLGLGNLDGEQVPEYNRSHWADDLRPNVTDGFFGASNEARQIERSCGVGRSE